MTHPCNYLLSLNLSAYLPFSHIKHSLRGISAAEFHLKNNTGTTVTFPSISSLSPPTHCVLQLRGIAKVWEALNTLGLPKSSWACEDWDSLLCGVLSRERSFKHPSVGAREGVAPFCNGVLGGRFLSKSSGESGPPKRTCFFFIVGVTEEQSSPAHTEKHVLNA